jgi:hypothetical protein
VLPNKRAVSLVPTVPAAAKIGVKIGVMPMPVTPMLVTVTLTTMRPVTFFKTF